MTDANAIRLIRSGDEKAIAAIMNKYSRMLWKTAARILTSSEEDIEEFQERHKKRDDDLSL